MISPFFADVPCPCRQPHRLPIDPAGVVAWACPRTGASYRLQLQPAAWARLQFSTPSEQQLAAEGVCAVHTAAPPEGDEQRCADCGAVLLSCRALLLVRGRMGGDRRPNTVRWFVPGQLVGLTRAGHAYLAHEPISAGLERRCYDTGRVN